MADKTQCLDLFRIVYIGDLVELLAYFNSHPGLDINIRNEDDESMLICCVKRLGNVWRLPFGGEFSLICQALIKRNIDVNLTDQTGNTAAHHAVEVSDLDMVKLLIANGARLDIERMDGLSAMDLIVEKGDVDWVQAVCDTLMSAHEHISDGEKARTALFHRFLSSMHDSCVWWLCENHPELMEAKDEESLSGVHVAVIENNVNALNILLEFKASIEAVDNDGHTPLHFAAVYGHVDCLVALLKNGSEVNCQDANGLTPLLYAISTSGNGNKNYVENNEAVIKWLVNYGASVTMRDNSGRSSLHWAVNADRAKVCEMMVLRGCPVNSSCAEGLTALHMAASLGHSESVRVLIANCGADVNIHDKTGYSPLFNAIATGHVDCAELLLCAGASPNDCNSAGNSPAYHAATRGQTTALEILFKYTGSLEDENNNGDRPLHGAALSQRLDAVEYMLKCNCEVNVRNKKGFTPLHLAASAGSVAICDRLLQGGATLNVSSLQFQKGRYRFLTPLDLARLNRHHDCLIFLKNMGGIRGQRMANIAARKIQRFWRENRVVYKQSDCVKQRQSEETSSTKREATHTEIETFDSTSTERMRTKIDEKKLSKETSELEEIQNYQEEMAVRIVSKGREYTNEKIEEIPEATSSPEATIKEVGKENRTEYSEETIEREELYYLKQMAITRDFGALRVSSKQSTYFEVEEESSRDDTEQTQEHKSENGYLECRPESKKQLLVIEGLGNVSLPSSDSGSIPCSKHTQVKKMVKTNCERWKKQKQDIKPLSDKANSTSSSSALPRSGRERLKRPKQCPTKIQVAQQKRMTSTDRKTTKLQEINVTDGVITSSKRHVTREATEEAKQVLPKRHSSQSNVEDSRNTEKNIKDALEAEMLRTQKLSDEVARLNKSLEERACNLDGRLKAIELKLPMVQQLQHRDQQTPSNLQAGKASLT